MVSVGLSGGFVLGEPLEIGNYFEVSGIPLDGVPEEVCTIPYPEHTPLDTFLRNGNPIVLNNFCVRLFPNTPFPLPTHAGDKTTETITSSNATQTLRVGRKALLAVGDVLFLPEIGITTKDKKTGKGLLLYVVGIERDGATVCVLNNYTNDYASMPNIPADSKLFVIGNAFNGIQAQVEQKGYVPHINAPDKLPQNYCQTFMQQAEQSIQYSRIANSDKRLMKFSQNVDFAITRLKKNIEDTFIWGSKQWLENPENNQTIYYTDGIWAQTDSANDIISSSISAESIWGAFKKGVSNRKLFFGGSALLQSAHKVLPNPIGIENFRGVDFLVYTNGAHLLYVHELDSFTRISSEEGVIVDPDDMFKCSFIPLTTTKLDLAESGQRNTEAVVVTESCCLVLGHPEYHTRIIKN